MKGANFFKSFHSTYHRMMIKLEYKNEAEKTGKMVGIIDRERCRGATMYQLPENGILIHPYYVIINPDYTVDIDWTKSKPKITAPKSPFDIEPHYGGTSCDRYEAFRDKSKIYDKFLNAWNNPILSKSDVRINTHEDRVKYIALIGGNDLKNKYLKTLDNRYCLYCFQSEYMRSYEKQTKIKTIVLSNDEED